MVERRDLSLCCLKSTLIVAGGCSFVCDSHGPKQHATGDFASSSFAELTKLYSGNESPFESSGFTDIVYGACNYYSSSYSQPGWDFCTGLGSPHHLK
jgi:hypothetical protein